MASYRIRNTKRIETENKNSFISKKEWNELKNEEDKEDNKVYPKKLYPEHFEKKQVVLLDTNALLMPFQCKINLEHSISRIIGECSIVVPRMIFEEIKGLAEREGGRFHSALRLAKKYNILEWNIEGMSDTSVGVHKNIVDKEMVNLAKYLKRINSRVFVVTNDKEMQKALLRVKVGVIGLCGGGKLSIVER